MNDFLVLICDLCEQLNAFWSNGRRNYLRIECCVWICSTCRENNIPISRIANTDRDEKMRAELTEERYNNKTIRMLSKPNRFARVQWIHYSFWLMPFSVKRNSSWSLGSLTAVSSYLSLSLSFSITKDIRFDWMKRGREKNAHARRERWVEIRQKEEMCVRTRAPQRLAHESGVHRAHPWVQ